jgi:hypothetical protein
LMAAKHWKDIIVLLLSERYLKLEKQENSGWGTFISEKKKCRIYLLPAFNRSNCAFLTIKLVRAKMHLKNHSNESKSNVIILEKLNKKERKNIVVLKKNH